MQFRLQDFRDLQRQMQRLGQSTAIPDGLREYYEQAIKAQLERDLQEICE